MEHLSHLNSKQKEAATHKNGPILIIAGAGTGKTSTLTHRILNLVKEGVAPNEVLAITFTNKAAKEMQDRVNDLLAKHGFDAGMRYGDARPFIGTFHSLGVHILRAHAHVFGLTKHFTIVDKNSASSLIKEAVKEQGIDSKQFSPDRIAGVISRQKGALVTLSQYKNDVGNAYFPMIVSAVWERYERLLAREKALDFDDLILKTVILLRDNPDIRKEYQNRWKYIHIDEYQDTNAVQYEMARLLAGEAMNICAVGDGDQNIYSWRGANLQNILNFEKDYAGAQTVLLEENYRSTQTILAAANDVIKKNTVRKEKNLFTKNIEGDKISLIESYDEGGEARAVGEKIKNLICSGTDPEDIAVLYRANFQSRALEEAFLLMEIPYQVLGVRFFERKEVKDILSYIRAGLNPESLSDIKRIIDSPPRGIGKATLMKMFAKDEDSLPPAGKKRVAEFWALLGSVKEYALTEKTSNLIKFVSEKSGLETSLKTGSDDDNDRLENIHELVTLATKYDILPPEEAVEKLLGDAALASDQDSMMKSSSAVKLMTVHAAKGLEFPYVFVTGLEQDLFPHKRMGPGTVSKEDGEEERRLFYVAITRAKKKLYLSCASVRTIFGQRQVNAPSEFLSDIDNAYIEREVGDSDNEPIINIRW
ncbi:MAG: ATP-dependent DNA helicase PcrA [Parcubacteria group bacterium GW2011_GWC1_42_11]|uniref:DNA 3'-5' helicase n=1 Tax=Candidatus Nomurabacteria bacterium GW2011_GWC2_42_20 TaxID=1618756 RepID=A0A0G1CFB2_9BACT|nr:MAG: ATP-dependent DNA helicase PcrA [Parcubacteria group bacterium GW2011_GWC1_42_11]KKS48243.1 MAG: ATP-dependent DNA helicase PcrA [Candidatus Nomurabacteria bacterium GW2011_GWC2_42_20]KKS59373.1 MAG: ATP-dependent DNA helicase PcrA [Candidatus Nomurabacteria bacterium GW2011_GWA2_42_41]KKT09816.1 MAG: ATP-dependent DNA helicase PcrA [Candidatus Nomurabacteria bacterium GW2011_GWB1_43_20]TAN36279.1 MAG: ATP-dependent DNA helicase PcrA [Patescibacteria group bacterium]HBH71822.1 ATP-depe